MHKLANGCIHQADICTKIKQNPKQTRPTFWEEQNRTRTQVEKTQNSNWTEPINVTNPNRTFWPMFWLGSTNLVFLKYNMKWLSENDVAYKLLMEDVPLKSIQPDIKIQIFTW